MAVHTGQPTSKPSRSSGTSHPTSDGAPVLFRIPHVRVDQAHVVVSPVVQKDAAAEIASDLKAPLVANTAPKTLESPVQPDREVIAAPSALPAPLPKSSNWMEHWSAPFVVVFLLVAGLIFGADCLNRLTSGKADASRQTADASLPASVPADSSPSNASDTDTLVLPMPTSDVSVLTPSNKNSNVLEINSSSEALASPSESNEVAFNGTPNDTNLPTMPELPPLDFPNLNEENVALGAAGQEIANADVGSSANAQSANAQPANTSMTLDAYTVQAKPSADQSFTSGTRVENSLVDTTTPNLSVEAMLKARAEQMSRSGMPTATVNKYPSPGQANAYQPTQTSLNQSSTVSTRLASNAIPNQPVTAMRPQVPSTGMALQGDAFSSEQPTGVAMSPNMQTAPVGYGQNTQPGFQPAYSNPPGMIAQPPMANPSRPAYQPIGNNPQLPGAQPQQGYQPATNYQALQSSTTSNALMNSGTAGTINGPTGFAPIGPYNNYGMQPTNPNPSIQNQTIQSNALAPSQPIRPYQPTFPEYNNQVPANPGITAPYRP